MNKEFVPYELALELKQLGFDDKCIHHYKKNMEGGHSTIPTFEMNTPFGKNYNSFTSRVSAPTYSQAFRWFREKGIISEIHSDFDRMLGYNRGYIPVVQFIEFYNNGDCYETYEEAELTCLKKLIEIVKGGNK